MRLPLAQTSASYLTHLPASGRLSATTQRPDHPPRRTRSRSGRILLFSKQHQAPRRSRRQHHLPPALHHFEIPNLSQRIFLPPTLFHHRFLLWPERSIVPRIGRRSRAPHLHLVQRDRQAQVYPILLRRIPLSSSKDGQTIYQSPEHGLWGCGGIDGRAGDRVDEGGRGWE